MDVIVKYSIFNEVELMVKVLAEVYDQINNFVNKKSIGSSMTQINLCFQIQNLVIIDTYFTDYARKSFPI